MDPLHMAPLPVLRAADESESLLFEREGFVDEVAVAALMMGPVAPSRKHPYPADLALAADDLDFAGWQLSPPPHPRLQEVQPVIETPARRPAPPVMEEPGLEAPHSGSHRWWLAGLAGVLATMLFSLLLLNLSMRPGTHLEVFFTPQPPATARPTPVEKPDSKLPETELTTISREEP